MNKRFIEMNKTKHNNIIFSKGAVLVHRIYARRSPKQNTKYKQMLIEAQRIKEF